MGNVTEKDETMSNNSDTNFVQMMELRTRARSVAIDLDSQIKTLKPPPRGYDPDTSFLSVVDDLSRIVDVSTLQAKQALAKVDQTIAKLTRLASSLDRSAIVMKTDPLTGILKPIGPLNAGAGRIWTNCQVLKGCLHEMRFKMTANDNKTISMYVVTSPVLLPTLAIRLSSSVVELQALNPGMKRVRFTIPANTVIRYYKKG